jgi:hypothetical protein
MSKNNLITACLIIFLLTGILYAQEFIASSSLNENGFIYEPSLIMDGNLDTAWCEGVPILGEGEWIEISFELPQLSDGLVFYPGFLKSQELFVRNSVPRKLLVTINDSKTIEVDMRVEIEIVEEKIGWSTRIDGRKENRVARYFIFPETIEISKLRISISKVLEGTHWQDTLISEVAILTQEEFSNSSKWSFLRGLREGDKALMDFADNIVLPNQETYELYYYRWYELPKSMNKPHHIESDSRFEPSSPLDTFLYLYGRCWIEQTIMFWEKEDGFYVSGSSAILGGGSEWLVVFPVISVSEEGKIQELIESSYYGAVPEPRPSHPGKELFLPDEIRWGRKEFIPDFF